MSAAIAWLLSNKGLTLLLMAVIAVSAAVCMRSCNKIFHPKPPRPDRIESYEVLNVTDGNTLQIRARRREFTLTLIGIGIPKKVEDESRSNLERLAGATIRCVRPHGLFRGEPKQTEAVEARKDFATPEAWGETGLCLQEEQLRAGLAISVGDIPKAWKAAENEARKYKRGIWK
jgi:endonuclease YncB( thermonuclease family)